MSASIATPEATTPHSAMGIPCRICGALVHTIAVHLKKDHAHDESPMTLAEYQEKFPEAPIYSPIFAAKMEESRRAKLAEEERAAKNASSEAILSVSADGSTRMDFEMSSRPFHEVFSLGRVKGALNGRGEPIPVKVMEAPASFRNMVPDVDLNYVFNLDILKTLMLGLEMNIPVYLWGHAGVGKTTIFEQIAARTGRPTLRVQHTANMEEEHVIGGWRLRDGRTIFELGPLAMAMKHGWLYIADEYDFGRPEVTSLYQPVLEGKPLIIKEADEANRVIRPHPNFRIVATGNTNGQGDDTGLYNGTTMQNAANYERFGVVEKMPYMDPKLEATLVSQQAKIPLEDAKKLVDFAKRVRDEFDSSKLSNPISPRSLIYAGRIGMARGSYLIGLEKAYLNRLTPIDQEAAGQLASRVFGK